ncbi:MAG: CBS domain-containing protein [Moorea sp. SIO3I7]|uniref:CBS domain-containing protein n=1 Tax=Moorena sp. SIO3I8 TaxID=2607833 RepID=UPI0013BF05E0|nr:CBS domain-containing protein [Moorena sp. SIO3I8]NEN95524.1 CBS domain-containing protein [Moorena sp. SIO3I7]NEO08231.1 CBS domain-containing protein [Moorena sp. SIO3I8]
MQLNDRLICAPTLEEAIDHQPLIVAPDTLLIDIIALMSKERGKSCSLPNFDSPSDQLSIREPRSSCVLIMHSDQLLGIFTERDIVRLTANGINFEEVTVAEVMAQPVITFPQTACRDIFAALFIFRRYRIRHLPIVDDHGQLVGVVSPERIRQVLRPANLLKLRRVSEVMTPQVVNALPTVSVLSLARLMNKHRVSCVVITSDHGEDSCMPVGIVTERDIVQFQSLKLNLSKVQAQDVMSTPLFLLSPEDSLWTAHQEMQKRRVRRLVVSWNWGQGIGIVTQTTLLRVFDPMEMYGIVETLQQTVEQLDPAKESVNKSHKAITPGEQSGEVPENAIALSGDSFNHQSEPPNRDQNRELTVILSQRIEGQGLNHSQQCEAFKYPKSNLGTSQDYQLCILLNTIQAILENLLNQSNLSSELRQSQLNSALDNVDQMRELIQKAQNQSCRDQVMVDQVGTSSS